MQRLKDLAISDTGFVFDPFSGATFTANGTALCIVDCLKRGMGKSATMEVLRERFDVMDADIPRDIDEVVQSLRMFGLVPGDWEAGS